MMEETRSEKINDFSRLHIAFHVQNDKVWFQRMSLSDTYSSD